jgi:hypothetical protein
MLRHVLSISGAFYLLLKIDPEMFQVVSQHAGMHF